MKPTNRPNETILKVLVVEDSAADAKLLEEAFEMVDASVDLTTVQTGHSALSLLRDRTGASFPDIVILDLGLPGMSGLEVLEQIKSSPDLKQIPVIVLTDTDDGSVVSDVYEKHANAYVSKSSDFDGVLALATHVTEFWGRVATLAPPAR